MEVLTFIAGLFIGWYLREKYAVYVVRRYNDKLTEMLTKAAEEWDAKYPQIRVNIKLHDGMFYAHNADDDHFIAQGATVDELQANLRARHPNATFMVDPDNLDKVGIVL